MPVFKVIQRQVKEDTFEYEAVSEEVVRDHLERRNCQPRPDYCEVHYPLVIGRCLTEHDDRVIFPTRVILIEKIFDGTLDELFDKEETK